MNHGIRTSRIYQLLLGLLNSNMWGSERKKKNRKRDKMKKITLPMENYGDLQDISKF